MIADFSDPEKMSGLLDPMKKSEADTQTRSWGTAGKDWALQATEPVVGWLRSATNAARAGEEELRASRPDLVEPVDRALGRTPEESKVPLLEAPDKYLGHLQEEMKGAISPRGQEILSRKWLPEHYEDPRATDEPFTTMFNQAVVPLAPQLALGYATRGASLAGKLAGPVSFGAIGAGEAANKVRDYADNTSMEELLKYEPVQQLNREFNGDEHAIRTALFHRSVDLVSELTNAGANMITFGFLQHAMTKTGATQRPFVNMMKNMLWGGAEGAAAGAAIGGSAEFGKQRMEINVGKRQAIDTGPIWHEAAETAMGLWPVVAGMHGARGTERPEVKEKPKVDPVNRTPGGFEPGIISTADTQLNPAASGEAPPPPPGGGPPDGGIAARQAQGYANLAAGNTPASGAGAPPPTTPPPGGAINTGAPPAPPTQPSVAVTPPAGRTPPVTPAPTAAAPVSSAGTAAPPPTTAVSPSQASSGAVPGAYPQVIHNGVTLNIMPGPTQLHNGIVYQKVSPAGPDQATYVPVAELSPVTSGVAPTAAPTPAQTPGGGGRAKVAAIKQKAAAAQGMVPEPAPVNTAIVPEGGEGGGEEVRGRARIPEDVAGFRATEADQPNQPATWDSNLGPLRVEIVDGPVDGRYRIHIPLQEGVRQPGTGWVPAEQIRDIVGTPPAEGGGEAEVAPAPPARRAAAKPAEAEAKREVPVEDEPVADVPPAFRVKLDEALGRRATDQEVADASTYWSPKIGVLKAIKDYIDTREPEEPVAEAAAELPKPSRAQEGKEARELLKQMRTERAGLEDGEQRAALSAVLQPKADFAELQVAADWARAHGRPDIERLASYRAEELAREAKKRTSPYPEGHPQHVESTTRLAMAADAARARAEEVKGGRRTEKAGPKEPAKTATQEKVAQPPPPPTAPAPVTPEVKPAAAPPRVEPRVEERAPARTFLRDDVITPVKGNKYRVTRVTERAAYPQDPLVRIHMEGADREHEMRASELDKYLPAKSIVRAEQGELTKKGKPRERPEPMLIRKAPVVAAEGRKPPLHHSNYEFIGLNADGRELWQNPSNGLRIQKWVQKNASGKPVRSSIKVETPESVRPEQGADKRYVRPSDFLVKGEEPVRPRPVERLFQHLPETTQPGAVEARRLEYAKEEAARRERGEPPPQSEEDIAIARRLKKVADDTAREEAERTANVRRFTAKVDEITRVKTRKGREFTGYERALDGSMNTFVHNPSQARYRDLQVRARRADAKRVAAGLEPMWKERLATALDAASAVVRDVVPKRAKETVHKFVDPNEQDLLNGINRLVRDAAVPRRETRVVREEATAASLGGTRITDREVKMEDEEFNRRQSALLKEARKLDLQRIRSKQEPYLEDMVPPPRVLDRATAEQAFHQILRNMERGRDLSPRDFMKSKYLTDRLDDLLRIDSDLSYPNYFQRYMAAQRGVVLPVWLKDKIFASRDTAADKYKTMFTGKDQQAYEAAKNLADAHINAYKQAAMASAKVDLADKWGLSWLQTPAYSERAKTLFRDITDREQLPIRMTDQLKAKIINEFANQSHVGTIKDAMDRAKYLLDKKAKDEGNASRQADFREQMFGEREGISNFGIRRTIADMFADKDGNMDAEKFGKFISTLFGQMERETRLVRTVDPHTGELVEEEKVLYSQLKRPKVPDYLAKRVKARGFGAARGKESTLAEGERKRFDKEMDAYTKRLNRWQESVLRQMESTDQLRKLLQGIVSRIKLETDNYTKTRGISPKGTIRWHLPDGVQRATSPYLDFTLGKDQQRFEQYAFANEIQRMLNHLDVDLKFLNDELTSKGGRRENPADEYQRYLTKIGPQVSDFAGKLHAYLEGNMEAIGEMRKAGNIDVTHMFNVASAEKLSPSGEPMDLYEQTAADPDIHEKMLQDLADKQQATVDAEKLREQMTRVNETAEQRRQREAAEYRAANPLRGDIVKFRRGMRQLDEQGLPTERPLTLHDPEEVREANVELNTSDSPNHPLISEPQTTHDMMDRVRDIITRGQAGPDLPLTYINDRFLEQLSTITEGARVFHAPHEVVSADEGGNPGYYVPTHDNIVMSGDIDPAFYAQMAIHETTHAASDRLLKTDAAFHRNVFNLLAEARRYAEAQGLVDPKKPLPDTLYGLKDTSEFIAESRASQGFRDFLERVQSAAPTMPDRPPNALQGLYRSIRDAFRRVMGTHDGDTALDVLYADQSTVLGKMDRLVEHNFRKLEDKGRPYMSEFWRGRRQNAPPLPPERERREQSVMGALDSNLRSYAGKTIAQAIDAGRAAAARPRTAAGGMNRAVGLPLHSTFDMTQRTSDFAFREHAHGLYEMMRRTRAEADRIMNEEDGPILEKAGTFFQTLSPAKKIEFANFVDEVNYHNAHPGAPLVERDAKGKRIGLNKHVGDADDLAWEQVHQQHDYMRRRYAEMAKTPGFEQMFKDVTSFYANKEKKIRSLLVRAFTEMNGLMPEGLDPASKQYGHLLNAFEKHINHEKGTLTPEELKALDLVDLENDAKLKKKVADIRSIDELKQLAGPYFPMVRNGNLAVFGRFNLPVGDGITRPADEVEARNGRPVDNGIRMSDDVRKLKQYVADITKKFGVTQIDGGVHYLDPATGERLKRYTPEELTAKNAERKLAGEPPLKDNYATKSDIAEMREEGRPVKERYWVQFSPKLLEKYDSRYDANQSIDRWRGRFNEDELKITPPEPAHKGEGRHSEQAMSDGMQRMIKSVKEHEPYTDMEKHQQAQLTDLMRFLSQKMVMHRGVRQRYLPRGFVLGASKDFMQAMADYSGSAANYQARMKFQPEITRRWQALADYNEAHRYDHGDRDAEARLRITEAIGDKLHKVSEPLIDNMMNRSIDRLTRWTMLAKLPGFGYFTQQLTEVGLLATPLMMGRHSPLRTLSAIKEAYGLAAPVRMIFNSARDMARAAVGGKLSRNYREEFEKKVLGHRYGAGLTDLVKYMTETGLYDPHAGLEYQRELGRRRGDGLTGKADRFSDYLSDIFQASNTGFENLNRFTTGSAAYIAERDRLGNVEGAHEKAMRYAWDIVHKVNGVYANDNKPEFFQRGPFHKMFTQFKQYPQRIMANYVSAAMGALKLANRETWSNPELLAEAKEKARQLAAMLVMQGAAAGALGLPTEVFAIPINALNMLGLINFNWEDSKMGFRRWAAQQFGNAGGDMVSLGVLRGTGIDFQPKISQSDMIFFGSPKSNKVQDLQSGALAFLGGAGGGQVFNVVAGTQKAAQARQAYADGNYTLADRLARESARLLVPFRAAADVIASSTQSTPEGMQSPSGKQYAQPLQGGERWTRMFGFNPVRVSQEQEMQRSRSRMEQRYKDQRSRYVTEFTTAGNPAEQMRVWSRVQEWNQTVPDELKLTFSQLVKSTGTRVKQTQGKPNKFDRAFAPDLQIYQ